DECVPAGVTSLWYRNTDRNSDMGHDKGREADRPGRAARKCGLCVVWRGAHLSGQVLSDFPGQGAMAEVRGSSGPVGYSVAKLFCLTRSSTAFTSTASR
ncbi:hypothetical protein J6590_013895, partial [Homalodisca vitripennis]